MSPPTRRWTSARPSPKGVCVIVHGLAEHSGRYEPVGRALAEAGYEAVAPDLRGHGDAAGWPGVVSSPDEWLDDLDAVVAPLRTSVASPLFLVAHSMGTLVALAFLGERGDGPFRGVVLSGIAVVPGRAILDSLADPEAPGVPAHLLSHDPAVVAAYEADPKVFNRSVPPECTAAAMMCSARAFGAAERVTIPALLIHGAEDAICDPGGSRDVHAQLASADKTLRIYEGMYHEVYNEVDRARVLGDLVAWLDAHVITAEGAR